MVFAVLVQLVERRSRKAKVVSSILTNGSVITSPDGASVAVPITTHTYFSDLLSKAISNGKEMDAKKLTANYLDRGLVDQETAFRAWLDS